MSEIFLQSDITDLLNNRFIVIIGDSIQRAVYKDFVMLLQKNKYLTERDLRAKGETTFSGDKLIEGGQLGEMTNGVKYREVRQYQSDYHLVRFYFVTRCYNGYVESILSDISEDPQPDVLIMNSCLWDISRYGSSSVTQYKKNLDVLFRRLNEVLPKSCLVIWNMTLPISKRARGGVLIPEVEHLNVSLRLDILEANFYVHKLALQYGYNTLDLHFFLRHQLQRRAGDGVHWDMTAHRRITNLILTHITEAWSKNTPRHARNTLLGNAQEHMMNANMMRPNGQFQNENFRFGAPQFNNFTHGQFCNTYQINQNDNWNPNHMPGIDQQLKRQFTNDLPDVNMQLQRQFTNDLPDVNMQLQRQFTNNFHGNNGGQHLLPNNNNNFVGEVYEEQQLNINKYGGPIRKSDFSNVDMSEMQIPNYQVNIVNDLGPYRNDNFATNTRRNQGNKCLLGPYRGYSRNYHNR